MSAAHTFRNMFGFALMFCVIEDGRRSVEAILITLGFRWFRPLDEVGNIGVGHAVREPGIGRI
jgi:hypothetical protein